MPATGENTEILRSIYSETSYFCGFKHELIYLQNEKGKKEKEGSKKISQVLHHLNVAGSKVRRRA